MVLPACAGVILIIERRLEVDESFTRMRGGDPNVAVYYTDNEVFYPHARG